MIKVDWSKAPEGTTHRLRCESIVSSSWRKITPDKSEAYYWDGETWKWLDGFDNVADISDYYDERPEEPEPVTPNLLRIPADVVPPPGATRVALVWYSTVDGQAVVHQPNPEQGVINLVGEQSTPEWDGAGIPPVGTVCMCQYSDAWRKVEIIGRHGEYLWVRRIEGNGEMATLCYSQGRFVPYLTESQRAAKTKKVVVDEVCRDVQAALHLYNANIDCSVAMRATIEALYDKGYFDGEAK